MAGPRVALVHDYLNQYGGAERVLEELHGLFPEAPIYTSIYWPEKMSPAIRAMDVRTSFMQRLPGVVRRHQQYLPFYPFAFASFDLGQYDLVISNSSAFCKGVRTRPGARHVCYCLTPMRWVWNTDAYLAREQLGPAVRLALRPVLRWLRAWDLATNRRVDRFVTTSRAVAERISRHYRRDATILPPPVDCSALAPQPERVEEYYLVLSRLIPYKRIDLAVDACTRLGRRLKIAGSAGRDETALRGRAGRSVEFLGRVSDVAARGGSAPADARDRADGAPGQAGLRADRVVPGRHRPADGVLPLRQRQAGPAARARRAARGRAGAGRAVGHQPQTARALRAAEAEPVRPAGRRPVRDPQPGRPLPRAGADTARLHTRSGRARRDAGRAHAGAAAAARARPGRRRRDAARRGARAGRRRRGRRLDASGRRDGRPAAGGRADAAPAPDHRAARGRAARAADRAGRRRERLRPARPGRAN